MIQVSVLKKIILKHARTPFFSYSCCVINLKTGQRWESNGDHFLYPASTYKIFIGAEVLRQVEAKKLKLTQKIIVKHPNDIDAEAHLYPTDSYPVLKAGDLVSVDILLSLMLGRSDNTASNCLIDLIGRENISRHIIHPNGWQGSEVTRKFLNRIYEDKGYRFSETTLLCGRHLAEFFQKVEAEKIVSVWVSKKLKEYMAHSKSRKSVELQIKNRVYGKGGWLEVKGNGLLGFLKAFIRNRGIVIYHSEGAIIQTPRAHFSIGILTRSRVISSKQYFQMRDCVREIERVLSHL